MIKSCFYCKISWGGKCSFTAVSFPSAVWYLFRRAPVLTLHGEPLRTFPQTSNLVLRAREGGRERHPYSVTQAPSLAHRHTPLTQLPSRDHPSEASDQAPWMHHDAEKRRVPWGHLHLSTRMPTTCLEPGLDLPWHPTCSSRKKSICRCRLPSASCNSNKVITEP